ncbi:hypothetical protein N4R57_04830 [Rhodobacteraceae bacterium D3-12]|nr:hypothetical protein N4R57_04830 [Rhodobacteraceae bacterium D3-12]
MNFYAIGFVAVAGIVGLGVDYQQQSVKAGMSLGKMSVGQYIDTYEARFLGAKAEKLAAERERQRELDWKSGGLKFLPEAPEGWTRRKYSEATNTAIMPDAVTYYEEMAKNGGAASIAENLKAQHAMKSAGKMDKTSWVYERGDEAIFISLNLREKINTNSLGGMIHLAMGGMSGISHSSVRGYDVIGGVSFIELPQRTGMAAMVAEQTSSGKRKGGFDRAHFRRLLGVIGFGQEVELTVHANAEKSSAMEILGAVDWDGLNNMLETPMATVGNDVVLPEELDPQEIAVALHRHRNQFNQLRSKAADFKLMNANQGAMIMNMYTGGRFDMSAGAIPDLGQLIEMGFRKEVRDLMSGRPSEGEYQRLRAMMVERPESERDLPKGEMSDNLREELMGGVAPAKGGERKAGGANTGGGAAQGNAPSQFAMQNGKIDYRQSRAFATVKMPNEMTTQQALYFKHTQDIAKQKGDGPAQQAARLMEMDRGLPPGSCLVRHDNGKVACNKNADLVRKERAQAVASAAPAAAAAPAARSTGTGGKAEVKRLGGGKSKAGAGCGAGKFCKANQ